MKDIISVIVPVYKVEKYLQRCIESIINQTYKNLEIILIDDGSPDNCGIICDEYAKKDNRIKVIHKENGGLSDARNAGLDIATGEYIAFIDSDDYIALNMFETLHSLMIKDNSDIALCSYMYIDENGKKIESLNKQNPIKNEILSSFEALKKIGEHKSWYFVVAWNKLYKKEIFNNLRFPYGKINEDEFIIHKVFGKSKSISCVESMLYYYVQRSDSIMKQNYSIKNLALVEAYVDRAIYLYENDFFEFFKKSILTALSMYIQACSNLDMKDYENRAALRKLKHYLKNTCAGLLTRKLSFILRVRFVIFIINTKLYGYIIKRIAKQ